MLKRRETLQYSQHCVIERNKEMYAENVFVYILVLAAIVTEAWETKRSSPESRGDTNIDHHYKRHMLPREVHEARIEARRKRRTTTQRIKEMRNKLAGNLRPLQDDDMENDEMVSVAVGPPAVRPKYEKSYKHTPKPANRTTINDTTASDLVKDVLVQLGREFLTHQVNQDYVFGQYVGICMSSLTNDSRHKFQHDVLNLIVKYQSLSRAEVYTTTTKLPIVETSTERSPPRTVKIEKKFNDTDEVWPDFTNLANIVG